MVTNSYGLFSPRQTPEEMARLEDEAKIRASNIAGRQPGSLAGYYGEQAGQGLARAAGAMAGVDTRSPRERQVASLEQAKAQVAATGLDPSSIDEYYPALVRILGHNGLVDEAREMVAEYQKLKAEAAHAEYSNRGNKPKPVTGKDALVARREALAVELSQLPAGASERAAKEAQLKAIDESVAKYFPTKPEGQKDEWKHVLVPAQEGKPAHVVMYNERTGDQRDPAEVGGAKAPGTASNKAKAGGHAAQGIYDEALGNLQRQYDAVVELHNHKGLDGITGRFAQFVGETEVGGTQSTKGAIGSMLSSADARSALGKYKQVAGGAFLSGLAKLKNASKTGATGLGAVSEREGDKVQSDAASLDRAQDGASLRAQLKQYAAHLAGYAARLAAGAESDGIEPKPFNTGQFGGPQRRGAAAPAAPAALPAGSTGRVVVEKDGKRFSLPEAQLQEAKKQGYIEVE